MTIISEIMEHGLDNDSTYVSKRLEAPETDEEDIDSNEADTSSDGDEESIHQNQNEILNTGWVDSISKILKTNKPKGKKAVALSKAKKLTDVKKNKPKPVGFEVETVDGDVKEEKIDINSELSFDEPPRKKNRSLPSFRVKPNILEKDRERTLQKIATKGVVQLFNAVKTQQKQICEKLKEAGPLEAKKEKILKNLDKRAFLDVLMGEKSQKIEDDVQMQSIEQIKKKEPHNDATWSVLKDDFMMTAKMKDWDKTLDTDERDSVHSN